MDELAPLPGLTTGRPDTVDRAETGQNRGARGRHLNGPQSYPAAGA